MAHPCSRDFAKALVSPGDYTGDPLCLPSTLLPLPSWKFKSTAQVTFQVPAGGWGHCVLDPQYTFGNITAFANRPIIVTGAGFGGSSIVPTGSTTGCTALEVRSPSSVGTRGPNFTTRLVTWGACAQNTTPLLNRGGSVLCYSDPNHTSISGYDALALTGNTSAAWTAVNGGAQNFGLLGGGPVLEAELAFQEKDAAYTPYAVISATATTAQVYTVSLVFHWEVIATAGSVRSPSHCDPGPSGSVVAAVQNLLENNPDHVNHGAPSFIAKLKSTVASTLKQFEPKDLLKLIKPAIATALSAYTGSPAPLMAYVGSAAQPSSSKKPAQLKAKQGKK